MTSKMIKDPIHGGIEFEGEAELALNRMLGDPFFQRLRRVKQLGFADYVFPSATHSRFAHSLGVYSVAKRMLSIVEPDAKLGTWSEEGQACLAAALLHDIGHGMFSHAFEKAMEFYFVRNPSQKDLRRDLEDAVNHEKVSHKIIVESSIANTLRELGGPDFPKLVAGMVAKTNKECIYTSIVSGQLDADRLDYAKRDPYFAGVSSGGIDLDWLIRNFKIEKSENGKFLYVSSKAYISLEQFTVTLFQLYPTLYLHKKIRGLEYMFALLMSRVFELIAEEKEAEVGLPSSHPFVRFFRAPNKLENGLLLDDTVFWGSLHLLQEARDPLICRIAKRIAARKIYPMHDIWKIADEVAVEYAAIQELTAVNRVRLLHQVCQLVSQELQENERLWLDGCYYDHYDRPIYKPLMKSGGAAQQINVEVGGKIVDIASISPIVSSAATFNIHRIYYDDVNQGHGKLLEDGIRLLLRQKFPLALSELV